MIRGDFLEFERELELLVPNQGASTAAVADARAFNAEASDVREAVLEPARALVENGAASDELAACLRRVVAELAFWRRVLVNIHGGALHGVDAPATFLVHYLLGSDDGSTQ